ncbi:MAG: hypothetical protein IT360_25240, partial [Gemmatimonadaceae bacterium]|nr:hypothetical protein [Gemmatimonadaceae bacterium]
MANPAPNVPPADLLKSFIARILKHSAAGHAALLGLQPPLREAHDELEAHIGTLEKSPEYELARADTRGKDGTHDALHAFVMETLDAYTRHPDAAVAAHASHLLGLL